MDQSFGKKEKLKSKILISRLFTEGKSITQFPLKLIYLPLSPQKVTTHKTAVSVPKRNFKKAVDRNFLKRLMREAFRKNKYLVNSNLNSPYAFMILFIGKNKIEYQKMFKAMEKLLKTFVAKELK